MNATSQNINPIRILHVVGGMNRGGVETWLMHVLRLIDRDRFRMDFLVHTELPCAYDDEIRSLGSKIIPCLHPHRPWRYARNFRCILATNGPYDVVHSHVHHFSGFVLRLAHREGVPIRIYHSHSDTSSEESRSACLRRAYLALMKYWADQHATVGLAASREAAAALFGPTWASNPQRRVLFCGIDVQPFQTSTDSTALRTQLGIPSGATVVGHVGRFSRVKNHEFLIEVFCEILKYEPSAQFLLVGDGELRPAIEKKVAEAGISNRVHFLGFRSDVPRLMLGAMDLFLMPSHYEGLPLTMIEAQVAGLPSVVSDVISEQAVIIKTLVRRVSLSQPAAAWASAIWVQRDVVDKLTKCEALATVEQSEFNIRSCVDSLVKVYSHG